MKINELVESLGDDFAAFLKDKNINHRIRGTPDEERQRTQDMIAQRQSTPAPAKAELSPEQRHELEQKLRHLEAEFDPHYQYSDDHSVYTKHHSLAQRIHGLKRQLSETASAGATSAANIGTVDAPHISPGKARGRKSYIGSPGKSGTKAPPQPKVVQPKNKNGTAKNGLDIKSTSLFGGPKVIKRR